MFVYWNLTMHLPFQEEFMIPFPPIKINGEQKYEVDDILDSRIFNHQLQ
jgi:hypothetical protein